MRRTLRRQKGIICLLVLLILAGWMFLAYASENKDKSIQKAGIAPSANPVAPPSPKDGPLIQKGDHPTPEQAYKSAIQTLSQEISQQTQKIVNCIYILTIVVGVITLLVIISQIVFEIRSQKRWDEWKRNFEANLEKEKGEIQLSQTVAELQNRINAIPSQVDRVAYEAKLLAEGQIRSFEKVLLEQIETKREPIERRLLVAEQVRFSLWGKVAEKILQAGDDIKIFLKFWHLYQKAQLAVYQMLSKEGADIFTGLNTLIDLSSEKILPENLNLLLTTLEEQKRIPLDVLPQVEKLRNILAS